MVLLFANAQSDCIHQKLRCVKTQMGIRSRMLYDLRCVGTYSVLERNRHRKLQIMITARTRLVIAIRIGAATNQLSQKPLGSGLGVPVSATGKSGKYWQYMQAPLFDQLKCTVAGYITYPWCRSASKSGCLCLLAGKNSVPQSKLRLTAASLEPCTFGLYTLTEQRTSQGATSFP